MLVPGFYTINSFDFSEGKISASVTIDAKHEVFKGHFPQQPVVPGVCLTQIVKELTEQATEKKLMMFRASNIKFMTLVDPSKNDTLSFNIVVKESETGYTVNCSSMFDETVAFKVKASYKLA